MFRRCCNGEIFFSQSSTGKIIESERNTFLNIFASHDHFYARVNTGLFIEPRFVVISVRLAQCNVVRYFRKRVRVVRISISTVEKRRGFGAPMTRNDVFSPPPKQRATCIAQCRTRFRTAELKRAKLLLI